MYECVGVDVGVLWGTSQVESNSIETSDYAFVKNAVITGLFKK